MMGRRGGADGSRRPTAGTPRCHTPGAAVGRSRGVGGGAVSKGGAAGGYSGDLPPPDTCTQFVQRTVAASGDSTCPGPPALVKASKVVRSSVRSVGVSICQSTRTQLRPWSSVQVTYQSPPQPVAAFSASAAGTFEELSGKSFRDFIAAGGNVQEALQVMEKGAADTGVSISDMFGSVEAGSAALALTGGGTEAFTNALAGMDESAGATEAAFEQMNQGLGATLDKLKAKFSVALLNIGEQIAPTVATVGEALGMLLELFSKIPGPLQAVILLVGTLSAGLFAFAGPILKGIELFSKLNKVFSLLAANPWVLAVIALVAVTVLIIKNWDKVKAALSAVWGWMKSAGQAIAGFFVGLWRGATSAVTSVFSSLAEFFRQWWPLLLGIFTGGIGTIVLLVVQNWDAIYAKVAEVMGAIVGAVQGAWNTVWSIVSGIGGAVVNFITAIPETVSGAFSTLAGIISAPFTAAFGAIKTAWNATVGGFGFKTPDWIPLLGGKSFTIPSMAAGGVLTGPQMFLGGEYAGAARNPEIVTPQNIMRDTVADALGQAGGAAPISLTIEMHVTSEVRDPGFFERQATELARVVTRELERSGLARGTVLTSGSR